jgi:hypothetical protein
MHHHNALIPQIMKAHRETLKGRAMDKPRMKLWDCSGSVPAVDQGRDPLPPWLARASSFAMTNLGAGFSAFAAVSARADAA